MLICVGGSSGSGKSTIARLLRTVCGVNDTLILSGDDLHKWERSNLQWNSFTHYNPEANNLELGHQHIRSLLGGHPIYRQVYDHQTGLFQPPCLIFPKPNIIYEGLHALYYEPTRNLADFTVFVRTDLELQIDWKVSRDIHERGYTSETVRKTIWVRKQDESLYISPQEKYATAVVHFSQAHNCPVASTNMKYVTSNINARILLQQVYARWQNEDFSTYGRK